MNRTVADPLIGRVLDGRYRVGPRIARGGMATVYEATDLRLDRVCALKIMHAGLGDDDDFAARFVREARAAARLSHPHVVAVYDQGADDGTLFLAMEYIPGRTLRDLLRTDAPLPPTRALALVDPVLAALGAAHQNGLIHRDVKPENVLLADDGRVKVADFGLARAVSAETQHTATGGVLIGTVSYLSPELVVDGTADARSDVYAVGVVLYELLTGRKPHEGDSPIQIAYKHVHEDVPPPSRLVPGIPPYVDALVARATARDRDHRPADARVLLHQVRRVRAALDHGVVDDPDLTDDLTPTLPVGRDLGIDYVRDEPAAAPLILAPAEAGEAGRTEHTDVLSTGTPPPVRPRDRPRDPPRRRRGPVLLALVLLLAGLAGVGGWWFGAGRYVSTPGVVNLPTAEARSRVHAAGLGFRLAGRAYSETVAAGRVVRTTPAGGERALGEDTVSAVVSRGPERHAVPVLAGSSLDQARTALRTDRLTLGSVSRAYDDTVPTGVVVSADPTAGTALRRAAPVDLVVSKGPKPVPVPDVTGQQLTEARRTLDSRGLSVRVARQNSDTAAAGTVVRQDPGGGRLRRGGTVDLTVSKGPVMVPVPDVRRSGTQDAIATLKAAGFQVRTVHIALYVGLEYVVSQNPGGGELAPKGSVITLSLV